MYYTHTTVIFILHIEVGTEVTHEPEARCWFKAGLGHCTFELLLSGPACISFNIVCMCELNTANSKLVLNSVYLITLLLTKCFFQGVMLFLSEQVFLFIFILKIC